MIYCVEYIYTHNFYFTKAACKTLGDGVYINAKSHLLIRKHWARPFTFFYTSFHISQMSPCCKDLQLMPILFSIFILFYLSIASRKTLIFFPVVLNVNLNFSGLVPPKNEIVPWTSKRKFQKIKLSKKNYNFLKQKKRNYIVSFFSTDVINFVGRKCIIIRILTNITLFVLQQRTELHGRK